MAARVQERTGLRLDPYFSASKLVWLLNHVPEARAMAAAGELLFGTVDTWLVWQFRHGQTPHHRCIQCLAHFADEPTHRHLGRRIVHRVDIPIAMLPEIVPSSGDLAVTASGLLAAEIPITAILGDQQAALFGHACERAGMAKHLWHRLFYVAQYGRNRGAESQQRLLSTVAWQQAHQPLQYALEGSVFMAGAIVQWLRDGLGLIEHSVDIETLAASVDDSNGVVLIPAFTGLGAPYWRADMQASLHGLTRGTNKAHIARAALEAIAFQVADVLSAHATRCAASLNRIARVTVARPTTIC